MQQQSANGHYTPEQRQASSLDALAPDDEALARVTSDATASRKPAIDDNAYRGPLDFPFAIGASIILWILLGLIAISLFG